MAGRLEFPQAGHIGARAYGERVEEHFLERERARLHLIELRRREDELRTTQEGIFGQQGDETVSSSRQSNIFHFNDDLEMETNWEGDNGGPPSVTDNRKMSTQERILYYAMYIQHFGISLEEITRMEELMTVIYGSPPPISYNMHVEPLNKNIMEDYNKQRYYFCSSCNQGMIETQVACENKDCTIYGKNIKRAKRMQRVEVHTMNFIPQLSDIIVRDIDEIITMHRQLHENGGVVNNDRSDIRCFDGYYAHIETADDFQQRRIKILLSVSIDGFRPRRISKREIWPLYLRIEGLPPIEANKYFNSIIAGAIYSRVKPTEKMVETLFSRLECELHDLRDAPLEVEMDGESWTLEVQLYRGIADMAAQQVLFGVPRWSSEYGCSKCYIKGIRTQNRRVWIAATDEEKKQLKRPIPVNDENESPRSRPLPKGARF